MANGCDQCMWARGVVAGNSHWIGMWSVASMYLKLSNLTSMPFLFFVIATS